MKRPLLALIAALAVLLCAGTAFAAIPPQPLPHPADASDSIVLKLVQRDYQLSEDYVCDVYQFTLPEDLDGFLAQYAELAAQNRYRMEETMLDGMKAYAFISYWTAYFIPDPEQNRMLLLVEDQIEFDGVSDCTRCDNGRTICYVCDGKGYYEKRASVPDYLGKGSEYKTVKEFCFACDGWGMRDCSFCNGTGKVRY